MKMFENKIVAITGASSGFGAAFADAFARNGASLILMARRQERLGEIEKRLRQQYGIDVLSLRLDVSDELSVAEVLGHLPEKYSMPDLLINNAGMVRGLNKVWETPVKDWDEMIDINVKGLLNVSAQIIPKMLKKNSGHIINVGSVSSHDTYSGGGVYCATKFAVKTRVV